MNTEELIEGMAFLEVEEERNQVRLVDALSTAIVQALSPLFTKEE